MSELFMAIGASFLAMLAANIGMIIPLFLWNRSESRKDIRMLEMHIEDVRKENITMIQEFKHECECMCESNKRFIEDMRKETDRRLSKMDEDIMHLNVKRMLAETGLKE